MIYAVKGPSHINITKMIIIILINIIIMVTNITLINMMMRMMIL